MIKFVAIAEMRHRILRNVLVAVAEDRNAM